MKAVLAIFSYGGVEESTLDSILAELSYAAQYRNTLYYHRISGDALIERSRSRAVGKFLELDSDVMVMVDHDIQWRPGDLWHVAEKAVEANAVVGGLYCKRARGKGWSSRVPAQGGIEFGQPGLIETPALATGFMAIPRKVIEGIQEKLDITKPEWQESMKLAIENGDHDLVCKLQDLSIAPIADGAYRQIDFRYHDYFRCIRAESGNPGYYQFLSEDWSFAVRAQFCGFKSYLSTYPVLIHHGNYGYSIQDGMDEHDHQAAGELAKQVKQDAEKCVPPQPKAKNKRVRRNS